MKVDVGFHRCGVDPASPAALELITLVSRLPGLSFRGLLSHAGHAYHAQSEAELAAVADAEAATLGQLAEAARAQGVAVAELSVGATPTARFSASRPGLTELRPGNYVYFDRTQVGLGAASLDDCALTVISTVVSKPAPDRIILDAGSKTLSTDGARGFTPLPGFGAIFEDPASTVLDESLLVERLSEEHATVRVRERFDGARARRPRPHPAQPRLRRLQPGRRGHHGRSRGGGGDDACGGARKDSIGDPRAEAHGLRSPRSPPALAGGLA